MAALPHPLRILILGLIGAIVGAMINWAIYAWPYFLKRSISPWMTPDEKASRRSWLDRIPMFGWTRLRRDHAIYGKGFWIRPLLIETTWAAGLPWFYYWQSGGGLIGGPLAPAPVGWGGLAETWFLGHGVLIALMFIATFIDFDERTIPDLITIPGTLLALLMAACAPWFRLPAIAEQNLAGQWIIRHLNFASPDDLPGWHTGPVGLGLSIAIISFWIIALLPKICTLRYGFWQGVKIMIASAIRPQRKTVCELRTKQRGPFGITFVLLGLGLACATAAIAANHWLPTNHWDSLFGSLVGLAFGGGMVWSIRVVARSVMGREAMGFGDVTLMAMIGAFLGWQAALLTFAIAPFAALLIVFVCFLVTKENELAFGPYLCFGCLILLLGWHQIWPAALMQFFFLGPWLTVILMIALVLMAVLLVIIQWGKGLLLGHEIEGEG